MNDVRLFEFEEKEVRVQMIDNAPWWVAKDVCDNIGLSDVSMSMQRLDDDEKLIQKLFVSGQERDVWLINESGLYSLILTSNKPEAKKFKKWITAEVLPSIRKTGGYLVGSGVLKFPLFFQVTKHRVINKLLTACEFFFCDNLVYDTH